MRTWVSPRIGTRWFQGAVLVGVLALGAVATEGAVQIGFATLFCLGLLVGWALWPLRELTRR